MAAVGVLTVAVSYAAIQHRGRAWERERAEYWLSETDRVGHELAAAQIDLRTARAAFERQATLHRADEDVWVERCNLLLARQDFIDHRRTHTCLPNLGHAPAGTGPAPIYDALADERGAA